MKKSRKRSLISTCSLALALTAHVAFSRVAWADCYAEANSTPDSNCVVMRRNDVRGVWFALPAAEKLRASHRIAAELRLQVDGLERVVKLKDEQLALVARALEEQHTAIVAVQQANDRLVSRAHRAEESLEAWHRSPWLWMSVGVVATLMVGGAVSYAFR